MAENSTSPSPLNFIFRFRYGLHLLVYVAAFGISWAESGRAGGGRVWIALPVLLSAHLAIDLRTAIVGVTVAAVVLAFAGASLRTWAAAHLGSATVHDSAFRGGEIEANGPFRYLRNPLYVGTVLHTLALSLLMSPSAAVFCLVSIVALQAALIVSEERFLLTTQGASYSAYVRRVPRIIPRFRGAGKNRRLKGHWAQAFVGEIYMWGTAVSFAVFGFRYNAVLVLQGVLVSLGLAIAFRGFGGRR